MSTVLPAPQFFSPKKCGHWQGPKKIIKFYPQFLPPNFTHPGRFFFHDAGAKKKCGIRDVFFSRRRSKKKCSHWQGPKKIIPWNQRGLDTHRHLFLVSQPHFFFHQKNVVIDRDQKKIMPWNQRGLDPHRHLSLMADIYSLCLLYFFC